MTISRDARHAFACRVEEAYQKGWTKMLSHSGFGQSLEGHFAGTRGAKLHLRGKAPFILLHVTDNIIVEGAPRIPSAQEVDAILAELEIAETIARRKVHVLLNDHKD